jgi:multiple sugar transport system permease protein/putative aldouronate transport system permease protein
MTVTDQQSSIDSPVISPRRRTSDTANSGFRHLLMRMRRRWQLYALLALPLAYIIVFSYIPILGAQIAFRDYTLAGGIWNSTWVGFANFERFFNSFQFTRLIVNTLTLGLYLLVIGFPIPIILALSLNQVRALWFKKTLQLVTYAPHFISTVVMVGLILQMLNPRFGILAQLTTALGLQPVNAMSKPELYQSIYVWTDIWQHMGFSAIIYLAALTTIDPALHEAAVVDGASKLQRILHIDIPGIMPIATMLLILNFGNFINIGFEKVLLLQNPVNVSASEILDTYVYKVGLASPTLDFSYATAIGLFKGVIALLMVVVANYTVKRLGQESLW